MRSLNRIELIGNLGQDPELRYTKSGKAVANFSLATSRPRKDKEDATDWHKITVWGQLAEIVEKYAYKGMKVFVDGFVTYSKSEGKDGTVYHNCDIHANNVLFLTGKGDAEGRGAESEDDGSGRRSRSRGGFAEPKKSNRTKSKPPVEEYDDEHDDEMPF